MASCFFARASCSTLPNVSKWKNPCLHEQYLELLNDLTRAILLSSDYDSTLSTLAFNMKRIIEADDCYILRWDEERQLPIPVTTTANLDFSFKEVAVDANVFGLTASILQGEHVIAVNDISNSPYASIEILKRFPARSILGVPLIAGNHKLGAAIIAFNRLHHFTADEIERSEQAGNHVALALWNFQQSVEIQQRLRHSHTLTEIGRALSEMEHGGSDRVLQLIVDSALDLILKADQAVIHIVHSDENLLLPMAIAGFSEKIPDNLRVKMQMGKGVAGEVIRDGITVNIPDVEKDPRFLRSNGESTFRSLMVTPIQSGKQRIGTISIQSDKTSAFSAEDEELLNALAINAAIAIDNTRTFEAMQQRLKEVNALYGTTKVLSASLDSQILANDVVALLQKNFDFYYVQLFLLDPATDDLVLKAGSGEVGEQLLKHQFRLSRGTGIAGHVAETGLPFFTNNVNDVVFFLRNPLLPDTQYELTAPIKIGQDVIGVLDIQDKPPKQFSEGDLQLVQAVGDQLGVALHKAYLYTDLQNAMQQEQAIRSQLIQSERLALVGRLLASVSHELNNPLQAIQNALFLLTEEADLSEQGRQDLGIVLSETERMAALIERLRTAYRPIRGVDFQAVELNNLIEDVYALISTHMRHQDIAFEFIPDPNLEPVSGISDQLRQVVLNLFLNAVEVMKPGGRLTVQTQNLTAQDEVLFSVKDTGPGIESEILPRIFDAFITSKHTGTGLGLTITHDILQHHHGRISAENHPQGGAIFQVWLPMCKKD
jgi:signal transduction histidine kinase